MSAAVSLGSLELAPRVLKGWPFAGPVADELAKSGERPILHVVRDDWRHGDLRLRIRSGNARKPVVPPGAFDLDPGDGRCHCGKGCPFTPGTPRPCLASSAEIEPIEHGTKCLEIGAPPALPRFTWFLEYEFFHTRERDSGRLHAWAPPDPKNDRARSSPPRWTDCDDRACPECGPLLELRSDRKHAAMVSSTFDVVSQDWNGELFGTGQERTRATPGGQAVRASRAIGHADRRIKRPLSEEDRAQVVTLLGAHPVKLSYLTSDSRCPTCPAKRCRCEWVSEALIELESPTALVARRSAKSPLPTRVAQAINRAQARMRTRTITALYVCAQDESGRTPVRNSRSDDA